MRQVAVLANQGSNYLVSGTAPKRQGNSHPTIVPYQSFQTKDGYMILAVGNDGQFARFCEAAGMSGLANDERFKTNPMRVKNRVALVPVVASVIAGRTTDEWVNILEKHNVPGGPINSIDRVFADKQVEARGLRLLLEQAEGGAQMPSVANPIRYSNTEIEYRNAPPALGAQTEETLIKVLGLTAKELTKIRSQGALG